MARRLRQQVKPRRLSAPSAPTGKPEHLGFKGTVERVTLILGVTTAVVTLVVQVGNYFSARERAAREWDFRAVELFVDKHDILAPCGAKAEENFLILFNDLFGKVVVASITEAAQRKSGRCTGAAGNEAATKATAEGLGQAEVNRLAQQARTQELIRQAPVLDAATGSRRNRYTVFIQYKSPEDAARARELQGRLSGSSYSTPGIEAVANAPGKAQVRYYHNDAKSVAAANALAAAVAVVLGETPETRQVAQGQQGLPTNVMEFWFADR